MVYLFTRSLYSHILLDFYIPIDSTASDALCYAPANANTRVSRLYLYKSNAVQRSIHTHITILYILLEGGIKQGNADSLSNVGCTHTHRHHPESELQSGIPNERDINGPTSECSVWSPT